jgi:hypothetical protein
VGTAGSRRACLGGWAVTVACVEWTIEFDDGGGADRVQKRPGPIIKGQTFRAYGRSWRVDRIEPKSRYAHAVPAS